MQQRGNLSLKFFRFVLYLCQKTIFIKQLVKDQDLATHELHAESTILIYNPIKSPQI